MTITFTKGLHNPTLIETTTTSAIASDNQLKLLRAYGLRPLKDGESHEIAFLEEPSEMIGFGEKIEWTEKERMTYHITNSGRPRYMTSVLNIATDRVEVMKFWGNDCRKHLSNEQGYR